MVREQLPITFRNLPSRDRGVVVPAEHAYRHGPDANADPHIDHRKYINLPAAGAAPTRAHGVRGAYSGTRPCPQPSRPRFRLLCVFYLRDPRCRARVIDYY